MPISRNWNIRRNLVGKVEFYEEEARKVLSKQKLIGTYRNDELRVLIKSYRVKTTGTNKPEFRDV